MSQSPVQPPCSSTVIPCQAGWGLEQLGLLAGVPAHGRRIFDLQGAFQPLCDHPSRPIPARGLPRPGLSLLGTAGSAGAGSARRERRLLRPRRARRDRPRPALPSAAARARPGPAGTMQVSSRPPCPRSGLCGRCCGASPAGPGAAPRLGPADSHGPPSPAEGPGQRGGCGPGSCRSLGAEVAVTSGFVRQQHGWVCGSLLLFLQLRYLFHYRSEWVGVSGTASV